MTTRLGRIASRDFEPDTPKIPEASFGKIRGSKPQIVRTVVVPSCTDDEAGPMTVGNARTREANPLMVGRVCPSPKSYDLESVGVSMISSMTTKKEGARAT